MKLRLSSLRCRLDDMALPAEQLLCRALNIKNTQVSRVCLSKKSVDARDKGDVHFVLSIDFETNLNPARLRPPKGSRIDPVKETGYVLPTSAPGLSRPVVVGLGPAGLFAALSLARAGLAPLVLERGAPVDQRKKDVSLFWQGGPLDENSNVQFGEGGAGAFSDGKLNSGISDPRCRFVLETLHQHGAPEEILYQAKPHVGTDKLPQVVKSIREEIISLGGQVLFHTALESLLIENNCLRGIVAGGKEYAADRLILAVGHSARDTFETIYAQGVPMIAKPFSIGARIEHLQRSINLSQYGPSAGHPALGAAEYKLNVRTRSGRGVYTFCMCPGGQVVAAASQKEMVVTNGMSCFARDGQNANSALLVSVEPQDFGGDEHPLSGLRFQQKWEKQAYLAGGENYFAPAQRAEDFLKGRPSKGPGDVLPTYLPGVTYTNLGNCLPPFVFEAMQEALPQLGRRLKGFDHPDALFTGVETRSSSPVRILRDETCQSQIRGLFPCGEGAGYAGGILSAAVDGLKCAQCLMEDSL